MASYSESAVLYRTNAQAGPLQRAMVKANIPFKVKGGQGFFQQKEVVDITAFISWVANPGDSYSLERASKAFKMKCAPPTVMSRLYENSDSKSVTHKGLIKKYKEVTAAKESAMYLKFKPALKLAITIIAKSMSAEQALNSFYKEYDILNVLTTVDKKDPKKDGSRVESAQVLLKMCIKDALSLNEFLDLAKLDAAQEKDDDNNVTLSTFHGVKGGEFTNVFVMGCADNIIPHAMTYLEVKKIHGEDISRDELEATEQYVQERNIMYVAITRAKQNLFMTHHVYGTGYGGKPVIKNISPFLETLVPYVSNYGHVQLDKFSSPTNVQYKSFNKYYRKSYGK